MPATMPLHRYGQRERGAALLAALLLMLAVLMTGIAAARSAIHGALAATHERDRMLALHGAMAALDDAELDIEGGADPVSARAAALAHASPGAFAAGCRGGAPFEGLCSHAAGSSGVAAALADPDGPGVALGAYTGAQVAAGEGGLPSQPPRYLIELMPSTPDALLYRITALGFGSADTTQVALQAYYRKLAPGPAPPGAPAAPRNPGGPPDAAPRPDSPAPPSTSPARGAPGGPGMRVGWREIGNWHDAPAAAGATAAREGR